ncbi:MAG: hypothetical protein JWO93_3251 [Micrococcaceae bacterium]|nr:hypothetical protein [Micrococcaceae bacterium]
MLDVFTLRVTFAVAALTLLVLFYLGVYRRTGSAYSGWWCLAILGFLTGSSAYLLNGTGHQWWANPAGNVLGVAGAACVWAGARSLRTASPQMWQMVAVPLVNVLAAAFDHPATNVWSGGSVFLASMALLIGLTSFELWHLNGNPARVQVPLAVTSGLLAVFYLLRCLAFLVVGPTGQLFQTLFGTGITTLLTMALLVVVSFSMAALSVEQVTAELRIKASQDGLTGLLNRSAFADLVQDTVRRLSGQRIYGSLIMADLDHFKQLNDRNGHAVGDVALRAFADACRTSTRATDLVARHGGEEFLLFLPGAVPQQAARVAAQISTALRETSLDGMQLPTVSYGISAYAPSQDLSSAVASADAALYQAKSGGRDQIVLAATSP